MSVGGIHCLAVISESGTGTAPLMWSTSNCSSTSVLLSTIIKSALLSILCSSSSTVIRGTRSEGERLDVVCCFDSGVGSGVVTGLAVLSGAGTGTGAGAGVVGVFDTLEEQPSNINDIKTTGIQNFNFISISSDVTIRNQHI